MSTHRLTFTELIGLTDEAAAVATAVRSIITAARESAEDGSLDDAEVKLIEAEVQKGIDALQALAAEVVAQATN